MREKIRCRLFVTSSSPFVRRPRVPAPAAFVFHFPDSPSPPRANCEVRRQAVPVPTSPSQSQPGIGTNCSITNMAVRTSFRTNNLVHKVNCKLSIWQLFSRCKRWRTDISHCRNDFLCWRTDALAKRPACLQKNGSARNLPSRTNSWTEDFSVTPAERVSKKWLAVLVNRSVNVV